MHTRTLLLLVLVALMGPAGSRAGAGGVPDGLGTSDWNSIRAEYERHRHAAFPVEGGHRARNFGQQWVSEFDGRGFLVTPDSGGWKWGLQLESYGWAGRARAVTDRPRVTAETERVTYDWDQTLREWYVNGGRGLEHGFTVRQQPAGRGDTLELNLAVRGGLEPRVRDGGRAVTFVDAEGRTAVTYSGLKAWDADGRALDARMEAAGGGLRLELKAGGARYPLTIDPIVQQAYLKASNTGAGDQFGRSVAISGDTVVVGTPEESSNATGVNGNQDDNSAADAGAAYVFVRNGGVWSQQAYLKASNTDEFDGFGISVAISGDSVVVGAGFEESSATGVNGNQDDNSAADAGAAYIFSVEQPFTSDGLVHAARFEAGDVAEQEIVSLFGLFLADFNADAVLPLGTQLGGASVDVTDSQGVTRPCLMFAARVETDVSSAQLNFIIAGGTATGPATLTVRRASGGSHSITIHVVDVAPGIFTANSSGSGVPAANALRFVDGQLTDTSLVFDVTAFPFQATPIDLGPANHQVFLSLFATGIRNGGTVQVTIDGLPMTTIFGPAASSEFDGLDQLNVLLERVLIGRRLVQVVVTVDGLVANVVEINIL